MTYGYGVKRADCWVTLSAEKTGIVLINCGVNGDTSSGMLARFPILCAEHRPDAVFVMGGANDIIFGGTDSTARSCIPAIIHQAQAAGIEPILGIPPRALYGKISDSWSMIADFEGLEAVFKDYCLWLRRFAESFAIPFIDFSEFFYSEPTRDISLDGIHPNKEGHILMSELFIKKLGEK